jgi:hypothetical protein
MDKCHVLLGLVMRPEPCRRNCELLVLLRDATLRRQCKKNAYTTCDENLRIDLRLSEKAIYSIWVPKRRGKKLVEPARA